MSELLQIIALIVVVLAAIGWGFKKLDLINLTDPSNQFVDPTIFTNPADGELGNSPVSYPNWHGWGTSNADMSLMKKF